MANSVSKRQEGVSLKELISSYKDSGESKKGIRKQSITMKAAEGDGGEGSGTLGSTLMHPTDEQLEKINQFTRSPKSAEEVVCFNTLSCNDLVDRDDDQFTTQTVKDFLALEQPYSSVGKSYMVSHDYTKMPVGRIYDVGTKSVDGNLFLTNEVYMPNTEQYKSFIENVDFGVYWAVSVGVMLGATECNICSSNMINFFGWTWCAENGHEKGLSYDPKSDETDDYGYAAPVDPSDSKAIKCVQLFKEPKDFFELSQVFLGAQYFASLDKSAPALSNAVKSAAKSSNLPIIGLSKIEAKEIPFAHFNPKVAEAHNSYDVKTTEDGSETWVDDQSLIWEYQPSTDEVLCLGKQRETKDGERSSNSSSERSGEAGGSGNEGSESDGTTGSGQDGSGDQGSGSEELSGQGSSGSSVDSEESKVANEEEELSHKAVVEAARKAKLPSSILEKLVDAESDSLLLVLQASAEEISSLQLMNKTLEPKAHLGDEYLKSLRSDAIEWYVKAKQQPDSGQGVNTETFERLLEKCGDNVDLIKELAEQQKDVARSRFPAEVRRSTSEQVEGLDEESRRNFSVTHPSKQEGKRAERLHG